MRSRSTPCPRHSYRPSLEAVEGRCLPGDALGWALLSNLAPFPDAEPLSNRPGIRRSADADRLVNFADVMVSPTFAAAVTDPASFAPRETDDVAAPGSPGPDPVDLGLLASLLGSTGREVAAAVAGPAAETGSVQGRVRYAPCVGAYPADPPPGWPFGPFPGVVVWLGDDFRVTDEEGLYQFADVPVGDYTAVFFIDSYGEARREVSVVAGVIAQVDVDFSFFMFEAAGQFRATFQPGATDAEIDALNKAYGVTIVGTAPGGAFRLQVPQWTFTDDYADAYRLEPIVQSVARHPILICA